MGNYAIFPRELAAGSPTMRNGQFIAASQLIFAITVATGTGLTALWRIDFTGVDYRQHPIATIVGSLLPSVVAGVVAYFLSPKLFSKTGSSRFLVEAKAQ
jgi:hypothetical protein